MLNTACYAYQPVTTGNPTTTQTVRIRLTAEGTTELARFLGPRVVEIEGSLSSVAADGALVVAPEWVQLADRTRQPWSGEGVVTIPKRHTQGVEQRTFDRRKTILASVFTAIGAIVLATVALKMGDAKGSPEGSGGTQPPP